MKDGQRTPIPVVLGMKTKSISYLCLFALVGWSPAARATYSIVATDQKTRQVGGAGTSCVGSMDVFLIYGGAPGRGAVHAQAAVNTAGRDQAVSLLGAGSSPADIIAALTDPGFDRLAAIRQYGVVDLQGRAKGYSGSENVTFSADRQGQTETYTYSIQGNILTSGKVLDQAEGALLDKAGCDLADRLMRALAAGAKNGEGDSRCTVSGLPADSAFIHIDLEDGQRLIHLSVTDTSPESPLVRLAKLYDEWRVKFPCPPSTPGGSPQPGQANPNPVPPGPDTPPASPASPPADPASPAADPPTSNPTPSSATPAQPTTLVGDGCASASGSENGWLGLGLLCLGLLRRRRPSAR